MKDLIQVQTTTDEQQLALAIGQDLVHSRLAACVQIGGPITSVYRWMGNVETATEWTCSVKTTADLFSAVQRRIRKLHTYEEPEIIYVEIRGGSPSYLKWLSTQLTRPAEPDDKRPGDQPNST